jgi:gluconokinase
MEGLSARTWELVQFLFKPEEQEASGKILVEECGQNLPLMKDKDEFQLERIRWAVLRIGLGDIDETRKAVDLAKQDWRDVLVWAAFGNDLTAHEKWAETTLKGNQKPLIGIIMGVSGSGKTTVGSLLAIRLNWMYYDADDFHTKENREKMMCGIPLTDEDRADWLRKLGDLIQRYIEKKQNMILACSALKESYRQTLKVNEDVRFVFLQGTYAQVEERMKERKGHYMKPEMLRSQFEILEEPKEALRVDVSKTPQEIVDLIRKEWKV